MRLTTRTNLAMRTLMVCAKNEDRIVRKSDIAELCNASENHLEQVIRLLAKHDFIEAMRGRHGGIRLTRPASEINVGAVFRVFEFDHPFAECFDGRNNTCPLVGCCWLRPALKRAVEAFYSTLDAMSLNDLVSGNTELAELVSLDRIGMPAMQCNRPEARTH